MCLEKENPNTYGKALTATIMYHPCIVSKENNQEFNQTKIVPIDLKMRKDDEERNVIIPEANIKNVKMG